MSNLDKMMNEKVLDKTNLVLAVRDYHIEKKQSKEKRVDFTVSSPKSDHQILIWAITKTKTKSGYIGIDTVRKMSETLGKQRFDKGVLIGPRFTEAARNEMVHKNIEPISQERSCFKRERLFLAIHNHIEALCKHKCGRIPKTEADCTGYSDGKYSCNVRVASDNAGFHLERGLNKNLESDLARLLEIEQDLHDNAS